MGMEGYSDWYGGIFRLVWRMTLAINQRELARDLDARNDYMEDWEHVLHGTHGSATSVDEILIHGNRYLSRDDLWRGSWQTDKIR